MSCQLSMCELERGVVFAHHEERVLCVISQTCLALMYKDLTTPGCISAALSEASVKILLSALFESGLDKDMSCGRAVEGFELAVVRAEQ